MVSLDYNQWCIQCRRIWFHSLLESFVYERMHTVFRENAYLYIVNQLVNREWSQYLEYFNSSGEKNWSHLKLFTEKLKLAVLCFLQNVVWDPFWFNWNHFTIELILTYIWTWNGQNELMQLYYALFITRRVDIIRILTLLIYPAKIHSATSNFFVLINESFMSLASISFV